MLHFHTEGEGTIPGDCFRACVASLFDLPTADVPHFVADPRGAHVWFWALNEWLDTKGMQAVIYDGFPCFVPNGGFLAIGSGKSPRGTFSHACIFRVDYGPPELIHDPHPSRAGLDGKPTRFSLFVPKFRVQS
jgi:hypothetical protein